MTTTSTIPRTAIGSPLTDADVEALKFCGISRDTAENLGQLRRVTHAEARDDCGIRYRSDHLEGIAFPYLDPDDDRAGTYRVRRDHPEVGSDGKPIAKYLSPPDRKRLYLAPGSYPYLADVSTPAIFVESEKAVLAMMDAEVRANRRRHLLVGTSGCWGWRGVTGKAAAADGTRVDEKGPLPCFDRVQWHGRDTIIIFDSNTATNEKVQAARRALAAELARRGARVRVVDLPVEEGINGPDDYLGRHGAERFFALVDAAKPLSTSKAKSEKPEKAKQGRDVHFDEPEPWPEAVDGADLLEAVAGTFTRYVALPKHASIALALWTLHAYAFDAFFTTAILGITSPAKRCGKTLLLIVLGALAPRRLFAANVTPAVLFRTIEKYSPTLLIDEADTFIRDNDELRGVLNSGHTRTTAVCIRAVGEDHDPRMFSTWCPKAIALIGKLPGTLADRAIEVSMRRRTAGEHVARLRQDRIEGEVLSLRRQASRWAADHHEALRAADPATPEALHDRAADCWRPLLAVADSVGGPWPARARAAALALSGEADDDDAGTKLLMDTRTIFTDEGNPEVLGSTTIIEKLVALEDRPWKEWSHGRPLSTAKLARLLAGYGIHPAGTVRVGAKTMKGYRHAAFIEAFERYLPAGVPGGAAEPSQRHNANVSGAESANSKRHTESECDGLRSVTNTTDMGRCDAVTPSAPLNDPAEPFVVDVEVTSGRF